MIRVVAHGCFDCLHIGHVTHLQMARALGDELVVALTADVSVGKGPGRPVFNWSQRCNMLMALKCVDAVYLVYDCWQAIRLLKPQIYVKGIEYQDALIEQALVEEQGGKVVFLDSRPVFSSTDILTGKLLRERIGFV